VGQPGLGFA